MIVRFGLFKLFKGIFDNSQIDSRKLFLINRYLVEGSTLNVGCGRLHINGAINMDIDPTCYPDIIADFHNLPFKDNSFKSIMAFDIIEHTDKPEILLKELLRVSKPQGHIVIECLDFDICRKNWIEDPTHKTYFNYEIFRRFLEPYGFKVYYLHGGMMVGVKNPKIGDRVFCLLFSMLRNLLKKINKVFGGII